jgi:hypothetical protein
MSGSAGKPPARADGRAAGQLDPRAQAPQKRKTCSSIFVTGTHATLSTYGTGTGTLSGFANLDSA